jgi:hypothetical protein
LSDLLLFEKEPNATSADYTSFLITEYENNSNDELDNGKYTDKV